MRYRTGRRSSRTDEWLRVLRRIVVPASLLFVPVYLFVRLAGGSSEKLQKLPDLMERIKEPIVWEVPPDGVRYESFFHAQAEPGYRFVVIDLRLEARIKMGFPVVPRCFRLVDDQNVRHYPLSRSPLFIQYGDSIGLEEGTVLDGQLLFEIPQERRASNLLFDRYTE